MKMIVFLKAVRSRGFFFSLFFWLLNLFPMGNYEYKQTQNLRRPGPWFVHPYLSTLHSQKTAGLSLQSIYPQS